MTRLSWLYSVLPVKHQDSIAIRGDCFFSIHYSLDVVPFGAV